MFGADPGREPRRFLGRGAGHQVNGTAEVNVQEVEERVREQVDRIIESEEFNRRLQEEKPKPGEWLVFNNSFVFRENLKTKKSRFYLATVVQKDGSVDSANLLVVERADGAQINDIRAMPAGQNCESLHEAIHRELTGLGKLVFLLVGTVEQDAQVSHEMTCGPLTQLTLNPSSALPVRVSETNLVINSLDDPEQIWEETQKQVMNARGQGVTLGEKEYASFLKAMEAVSEKASATLRLPSLGQDPGHDTFLDRIARALEREARSYEAAVEELRSAPTHREKYTEVLRIAYNFATEALTLITLFTSIGDLKPIVFWTTAFGHWNLYLALCELPWLLLNKKPSLSSYEEIVKNARNRAFHHLFPISTTLVADLSGVTLRARRMTLFPEYKRSGSTRAELDYEDRELVDVLTQFTRTKERWVGLSFWEKNIAVLARTAELASDTAQALKLLNKAVAPAPRVELATPA